MAHFDTPFLLMAVSWSTSSGQVAAGLSKPAALKWSTLYQKIGVEELNGIAIIVPSRVKYVATGAMKFDQSTL
jgi:hypothetical protein